MWFIAFQAAFNLFRPFSFDIYYLLQQNMSLSNARLNVSMIDDIIIIGWLHATVMLLDQKVNRFIYFMRRESAWDCT